MITSPFGFWKPVITARSELRKIEFLALSVTFFDCVGYEISPEPLNGFAPNSQERRVLSLARSSLKKTVYFAEVSS